MSQIVKLRRSSVSGQKPTNSNLQLGELALNTTDGKVYMSKSGSLGPSVEELISTNTVNTGSVNISGSINLIGDETITGSLYSTNIISGSQIWGDGSNLINIPLSGVTNLVTISGSFNNRINDITSSLNSINTFSSSVVLTSQTSSMTVMSASYAVTAAYALNAGAGGGGGSAIGSYSSLEVTSAASTWSFAHNSGQQYPIFQVFDSNGLVVIPSQIRAIDEDLAEIIFPSPQTGRVIASLGGGNGTTQEFINSNLWTVNHNLGTDYPDVTVWDSNRNIIFPNRIESVNTNQIKVYFSVPVTGHVSVSRGGHLLSGSVNTIEGLVSGSSQLTGSYDTRYVLSGSITQTTWDNIANKPSGLISGSVQVELTGTTGYSTFSSSVSSSIGSLSSSVASTDNTQNGRLDSLETASGSIRTDFNSFTSSYTTVSGSLDSRLDVLEAYSGSQLVPSSSMSFRTLETSVYCKNITGTQINKGTVVRIVGSVGDNPLIAPANLLTEGASANTLGFATQNIPNDDFGMVITEGILIGVNTSGMTAGDLLYLGANGTFTTTPPVAPNHGVRLGEVLRVQQNQGSIYVRVDNGIELNEAHDVIYSGEITHGDLLIRSGSVWKNGKSLEGNYVVTGSLTVTQNLTVLGSSSLIYVTSSQLAVSASTISVNVFEPAERFGGLKVYDSGSSSATASLLWDSLHNHWVYQNVSGSNYSGGMLLSGPRNTGSLGDEPTLINGRIAKSVGGDHLDNSIISETGTTITIAGDLVANSITGAFDYFGLINRPTLISGSSQIDITGTTGYSTFSSSVSTSIGSLSGSVATTTSDLSSSIGSLSSSVSTSIGSLSSSIATTTLGTKNRVDSIETKTGSYATTGSNTFIGTETISGSILLSGSLIFPTQGTIKNGITTSQVGSKLTIATNSDGGLIGWNSTALSVTYSPTLISTYPVGSTITWQDGSTATITQWDDYGPTYIDLFWNTPKTGTLFPITLKTSDYADAIEADTWTFDNSGSLTTPGDIIVSGSLITTNGITGSIAATNGVISGSAQLTGSFDTRYVLSGSITQTTWDNIASKPSGIVSGSSQILGLGFLQTGSYDIMSTSIDSRVSSLELNDYNQDTKISLLINKTGSYATTGSNSFIGNQNINGNLSVTGSVVISGSLDLSNANVGSSRYLHTQTNSSATWSITHNLGYSYPNVTIYDGSNNKVMLPADVTSVDQNTTQVTFATPELGYALVSVGGISTGTADRFLHTQNDPTGSWIIDHNLGYKFPNIDVYDVNDEQLIPQKVKAVSLNRIQIDFATATSGNAIISMGGARSTSLFVQSGSFYNATTNIGITGSLVVTGDVDADNFNTTSDKKLKTNLVRIENALDKIEKLNGYTFDWIEEYSEDRTRQIGMVADEVYEVQPELISHRDIVLLNKEEKIKLLDYSKVTALLIEAIKELNDKVTKLENKKKKK